MADWQAFLWVVVGVLLSSVLPYAVTALWPARPDDEARAAGAVGMAARELFGRIWPGVRMLLASLVVGGVVLAGAMAAGYALPNWWTALLVGLAADRSVQVVNQMVRRNFQL
jgi:hypothetical protein